MHYNYKHYPLVALTRIYTEERNVVQVCHFLYIKLKFSKVVRLAGLYSNIFRLS